MKLLADPSQAKDPGDLLPIPEYLQKTVPGWAGADYRQHDFGYLLIQQFLSRKFNIFIRRMMIQKPVLLYSCADKPTILLQFTIHGNIPYLLGGLGKKLLLESNFQMFYIGESENKIWLEPGDYETIHIELEPSFLMEAAAYDSRIESLLERFQSCSLRAKPLLASRINYRVKEILNNLRHCRKTDGDLIYEIQEYIVELLSLYVAELNRNEVEDRLPTMVRKESLIHIHDQVLQNPNMREQTLRKLAEQHKINMIMLKRNFKALFGETLVSFVRIECMKKALWLLSTTHRNVNDIAEEIGYDDKSNFAKSFRRQFGKAPNEERPAQFYDSGSWAKQESHQNN
jgi:AraC-like DNA-binding protein